MKFILIISILIFQLPLFGQNIIPVDLDSLLNPSKSFTFQKWTKNEVEKMDSISRPKYYEGGVIVFPKFEYYLDTIYVDDLSGVSMDKLCTKIFRNKYEDRGFYRLIVISSFLGKEGIFLLRHEIIPYGCVPTKSKVIICQKYRKDFPNGLPQKMEIRKLFYKKAPYLISWKKWELKEKYSINENKFGYFAFMNDDDVIKYYSFPSGYYSIIKNGNSK